VIVAQFQNRIDFYEGSTTRATIQIDTTLKIRGKPQNSSLPLEAEIRLYPVGTEARHAAGQPLPPASATLKVMVLPERRLTLGVWKVEDSASAATALGTTGSLIDTVAVFKACNDAFRSCCVTFDPVASIVSGDVNYDSFTAPGNWPGGKPHGEGSWDGLLQTLSPTPGVESEWDRLFVRFNNEANYNVAIVNKIDASQINARYPNGLTFQESPRSVVSAWSIFVLSGSTNPQAQLFRTAAHEVGHGFGLSTRYPQAGNHERDPVPPLAQVGYPLMKKGSVPANITPEDYSFWTRHEDWKQANDHAKKTREGNAP